MLKAVVPTSAMLCHQKSENDQINLTVSQLIARG